jgi:exopolysaccharide biosynthesis polyprenyl glycosylphosphotransferase
MSTQKLRPIYSITLVTLDALMVVVAFIIAYQLRARIPWPAPLANDIPIVRYTGLIVAQIFGVLAALFFFRQYNLRRAISRVDQFYSVFAAVSIGTMIAVALSVFSFKNSIFEVDYPRAMIIYAWLLTIVLITFGRAAHQIVRDRLRDGGLGKDRLLIVGTGEVARIIIQRILWAPKLGYELVGVINGELGENEVLGVPVIGKPEDLPDLIERHKVDEVIIAIPEEGHREVIRVISYCERGRVTIKVFPDFFQFIASEADIDDLGGLPLLSIRNYAMRGYRLMFKRTMDVLGAIVGLIIFSPMMILTAIAIKLESPGPVFFIQERMGLDGRPFLLIKFRSMREDAEREGPAWTVDDDPRRTRLGTFLRKIEIDELPQFINVLLGEMSLVGPRPEQTYYVNLFRESVPRYMERHREKAGMTGWAQVNGLRGDTSIVERTKYDVWYTENWSILLDIKIILRTFWQIFPGNNHNK